MAAAGITTSNRNCSKTDSPDATTTGCGTIAAGLADCVEDCRHAEAHEHNIEARAGTLNLKQRAQRSKVIARVGAGKYAPGGGDRIECFLA